MLKKLNNNTGFTLLELLLSAAVISGLAGLSLPVYRTLIKKNDLDLATNALVASLRRAQVLSQAVDGDTTWGVKIQSGEITLFKGQSYTGRDTNFDEIFDMPTAIRVSGTTEVVFTKLTGFLQTSGTINLLTESDSRSVAINEKGTIGF